MFTKGKLGRYLFRNIYIYIGFMRKAQVVTLSATAMLVLKVTQAQGEQTSNVNQKNMTSMVSTASALGAASSKPQF